MQGSLLDVNDLTTNRDIDKADVFNTFFAFTFNADDGLWPSRCPKLEDYDCGNDQFPANAKLAWHLLLHLHVC